MISIDGIPDKALFRPAEVAELLSCSTRTVNRWANAGEFGPLWQKGERGRRITKKGLLDFYDRYKESWAAGEQAGRAATSA